MVALDRGHAEAGRTDVVAWLSVLGVAWLPAAIGGEFGPVALEIAAGVSFVSLLLLRRMVPGTPLLLIALLEASALTPSGLVPAKYQYVPTAVAGAALLADFTWSVIRKRQALVLAPRMLLAVVIAYAGWAIVTTVFSINRGVSTLYAVGIVLTLSIAFVVVPSMRGQAPLGRSIAHAVALLGVLAALASGFLMLTGPITLFDRLMGQFLITEVTIDSRPIGLIVPWASGVFLSPASQTGVLAIGLVALLWLRSTSTASRRRLYAACTFLVLVALLMAFARTGWLAALTGTLALAVYGIGRRQVDWWSVGTSFVLAACLGLILSGAAGAIVRPDLEQARYGAPGTTGPGASPGASPGAVGGGNQPVPTDVTDPSNPGEPATQVRGGASLSGRFSIWKASVEVIGRRPVLGYGLGTDAIAIETAMGSGLDRYRGLTSHSTWLRTGVELGLPGLAILIVFVLLILRSLARAVWPRGGARLVLAEPLAAIPALGAMFLVLLSAQTFETSLLGGWNFPSLAWAICAGAAVGGVGTWGQPARRDPAPET